MTESPVSVEEEKPVFTATNTGPESPSTFTVPVATVTPTEEPIVETPIPTKSLPSTLTPTPTEILPVEWDIDPYIIEEIEGVYRGVTIKARLIVDRSLEDIVESVEVNDDIFAELMAKMLATVWYAREKSTPYEIAKPPEFIKWVDSMAKAQETGYEYYWRYTQLNRIWANDINDGNGYVEKLYNFWPTYEGVSPYGVVGIEKITIVIFDVDKTGIRNFDTFSGSTKSRSVSGCSVDNGNLLFYSGCDIKALAADILESTKYDYNPYTQKSATQYALQLRLVTFIDYLIYNDADVIFEENSGVGNSIWGLVKQAIKYEIKD